MKSKNKFLRGILLGILGIIFLGLLSGILFYLLELRPRIQVVTIVGKAFTDSGGQGDMCQLTFDSGQEVLLDFGEDRALSGSIQLESASYDGLEFGYFEQGLWLHTAQVSDKYYLLPWTDDVGDQIESSALVEILGLTEDQQLQAADALTGLRRELTEQEELEFTPTLLNCLLGLRCLKGDVLELYRDITFQKGEDCTLQVQGEERRCSTYHLELSKKDVRILLKTEGAGSFLNAMGDLLGDTEVDVYLCDGALVKLEIDTSLDHMPQIDLQTLLDDPLGQQIFVTEYKALPLTGTIWVDEEGALQIEAKTTYEELQIETALTLHMVQEDGIRFESDQGLNILQAGKIRLFLEARKWAAVFQ
jgi:hypothetical protein